MIDIKQYDSIMLVPKEWDSIIGDNLYLSIEFLTFMEEIDKCNQKYYMIYVDGKLDSVFMTYIRLKYNMAMFTRFNLPQKMQMVYVPLSVTRPGISCVNNIGYVFDYIKTLKGPKMILNLDNIEAKGYAKGLTCPKCIWPNHFKTFDEYLNSLRSGYRRR